MGKKQLSVRELFFYWKERESMQGIRDRPFCDDRSWYFFREKRKVKYEYNKKQ